MRIAAMSAVRFYGHFTDFRSVQTGSHRSGSVAETSGRQSAIERFKTRASLIAVPIVSMGNCPPSVAEHLGILLRIQVDRFLAFMICIGAAISIADRSI
jgi:hypothetical protein